MEKQAIPSVIQDGSGKRGGDLQFSRIHFGSTGGGGGGGDSEAAEQDCLTILHVALGEDLSSTVLNSINFAQQFS